MTKDGQLVQQSIQFSIELVGFYKWLCYEKHEYVLSRQVLKSGTSIGANIHEAIYGASRADFAAKLQISLKEASETEYWF
jgi:four helix bundle protein